MKRWTPLPPDCVLPPSARSTWRVFQPGNGIDVGDVVLEETVVEQDALIAYRDRRERGLPVLVSRWQIYRVHVKPRRPTQAERFAFVESYDEEDARARVVAASARLDCCEVSDARSRILVAKSYEDCIREGVSADVELRLFEVAWSNGRVAQWVQEPMFWLPTPSELTRKWSQIREGTLQ